jgi:peptidoglycan/xylan/chitin deacetylase (PgdA/CDA1 family)
MPSFVVPPRIVSRAVAGVLLLAATVACGSANASDQPDGATAAGADAPPVPEATASLRTADASSDTTRPTAPSSIETNPTASAGASASGPVTTLPPNEYGRIPIVEYHLVVDQDGSYAVSRERFRAELDTLYARGYRPIGLGELLDKRIDLPRGTSPVLFVFDDASPSQFRYIERDGALTVDPTSALGLWLDFAKDKPEWRHRGAFCLLSGAEAGRSFFGNKGIEGQQSAWRFRKLAQLDSLGFELCNHTLWHARLDKYDDAFVQEQIARGELAIDSAMPGYRVRGFALPLGMWPKNRPLAWGGAWTDPKSKRTVRYAYDAVFEVAGGPARSPHDPQFNPRSLPRIPLGRGMPLYPTLRTLEKEGPGGRYVSDGDPTRVAGSAP